jgi:hypothetical protein
MCTSHCDVRKADGDGIRRWSVRRSAMRAIISMAALCVLIASPAKAIRPDECEQQRAAFPKEWNDVSKEKPLFFCWSHYSGAFKVTLGADDKDGRRLMSLVPLTGNEKKAKQDTSKDVFRIWLDKEQARRLEEGKYFATIVRQKGSCWIRGALSGPDDGDSDSVFFLDMANPKPDSPDAGSFYNKAPRFSIFHGDSYECEAVK